VQGGDQLLVPFPGGLTESRLEIPAGISGIAGLLGPGFGFTFLFLLLCRNPLLVLLVTVPEFRQGHEEEGVGHVVGSKPVQNGAPAGDSRVHGVPELLQEPEYDVDSVCQAPGSRNPEKGCGKEYGNLQILGSGGEVVLAEIHHLVKAFVRLSIHACGGHDGRLIGFEKGLFDLGEFVAAAEVWARRILTLDGGEKLLKKGHGRLCWGPTGSAVGCVDEEFTHLEER